MRYILTMQNFRTLLIIIGIIAAVWFWKDYQFQKTENIRQSENASQLRKADSLRFTSQLLTSREIQEYLQYSNPELKKNLEAEKVNYKRIQTIVSQTLRYRDLANRTIDVSAVVSAVNNREPISVPFIDSTKCLTVKGVLRYENDSLKLTVTDRSFNNKSDAVVYWERRQWRFLGIKTRFLGKKQFTAKNYSNCGEISTVKIEKKTD